MASKDDAKPGDGPRRPTPTHPPYAEMIATAIRSLCEEGGSSVSSISSYIQANYAGLPSGHDRLLPFYLNTYTANGLFMVSGPDHYNLSLTGGHQQQDGGGTAAAPDQPPPQP
uniref:H15 domain-containing protein n=1 Tax=Ananas comosus var. bracteatus TaxID=296719 RepID=A0A6V7QQ10_ANACO|nr:unnamed protein product [Ananas comosus var. bracteatus]